MLLLSAPPEIVPGHNRHSITATGALRISRSTRSPSLAMHSLIASKDIYLSVCVCPDGEGQEPQGSLQMLLEFYLVRRNVSEALAADLKLVQMGAFIKKHMLGHLVIRKRSNRCIHTHWLACNVTYVTIQYVI